MIKAHEANSTWWGSQVGIVTDAAFFGLTNAERRQLLAPFAWVEFKARLADAPPALTLQSSGFAWADVQINFRIDLRNVPDSPSLGHYHCSSAAEQPFWVDSGDLKHFEHERFLELPGMTPDRLSARYAAWANELVARNPEWCLRMTLDGRPQGWFFAEPAGTTVSLTLAMLSPSASAPGQHLYQRCLREFATRGGVLGRAAFSVRNTPVLNIYSSLRAHFTAPSGVWMWVANSQASSAAV